eukprot:2072832-Alexandrium_andersonii.AAC.1
MDSRSPNVAMWQMALTWPPLPSLATLAPTLPGSPHGSDACPEHAFAQLTLTARRSADFKVDGPSPSSGRTTSATN